MPSFVRAAGVWVERGAAVRLGPIATPRVTYGKLGGVWRVCSQAVTIAVSGGFSSNSAGGGSLRDVGTFNVSSIGGSAPTGYTWAIVADSGGHLYTNPGAETSPTFFVYSASAYNPLELTDTCTALIRVRAFIDGQTYEAEEWFNYKAKGS